MSIINGKVRDKKTGDIGNVIGLECKYINGGFSILLKIEFIMDGDSEGDILIFKKSIKDVIFI